MILDPRKIKSDTVSTVSLSISHEVMGPDAMIFASAGNRTRGFPGGPVVKNLPSSAGDVGSIPGQGTKIPHTVGQLSLCAATR